MSTRLHGVNRQCVERGIWATIQLESRGGVEEVTFSCRETTVFPKKTKKLPPNARRQQYNRERREAWLNKQKRHASGPGPTAAASSIAAAKTTAAASVTAAPSSGVAAAKAIAAALATAAPLTGAAAVKTPAGASATAAPSPATATATGEAATSTPPRKKMKAPYATRCSTRSTVIATY
jgi:hypothetical protein